jgi:hypothetical protein
VQANPLPEIIALGGYVNSEMNIYTIYPDASDFEPIPGPRINPLI